MIKDSIDKLIFLKNDELVNDVQFMEFYTPEQRKQANMDYINNQLQSYRVKSEQVQEYENTLVKSKTTDDKNIRFAEIQQ